MTTTRCLAGSPNCHFGNCSPRQCVMQEVAQSKRRLLEPVFLEEARRTQRLMQRGQVGESLATASSPLDDLDLQVKRLDVENGDILVVRTRHVLTSAQAERIHDVMERLVRRHGVRDVSVLVFDNNSDLTVERPGSTS